jgi:hypothetical protein
MLGTITAHQLGEILGFSTTTVQSWIRTGVLHASQNGKGRARLITRNDLTKFLLKSRIQNDLVISDAQRMCDNIFRIAFEVQTIRNSKIVPITIKKR